MTLVYGGRRPAAKEIEGRLRAEASAAGGQKA